MYTPGLVQCGENIASDDLIAHETQITKQLMVVRLTVGHTALLVVPVAKERLFTLGTHKVLYVPVLAQRGHYSLLDRTPTGTTNRNAHTIMAPQTVQLVHIVGRVPATILHLASRRVQFCTASRTVEVIPVINFTPEA